MDSSESEETQGRPEPAAEIRLPAVLHVPQKPQEKPQEVFVLAFLLSLSTLMQLMQQQKKRGLKRLNCVWGSDYMVQYVLLLLKSPITVHGT